MLDTKARSKYTKTTKKERSLAKRKPVKMTCPYCGRPMQLRHGDAVYRDNNKKRKVYVCTGYPECDTYVRTEKGTLKPIGTPANSDLRRLRYETHQQFDQLWQEGLMSRHEAYLWLSTLTGLPEELAHIGEFREGMCCKVIEESKKLLEAQGKQKRQKSS